MKIQRISDGKIFKVYGTKMSDLALMPTNVKSAIAWFLIWDKNEYHGQNDWIWVPVEHYIPYNEYASEN